MKGIKTEMPPPYPGDRDAPCRLRSEASHFGLSVSAYLSAQELCFLLLTKLGILFGVVSSLDSLVYDLA